MVLLISPAGKKIKSLAEMKKKKVALVADCFSGATFIRKLVEVSDDLRLRFPAAAGSA